jgi:flagellar assembly protein FliH
MSEPQIERVSLVAAHPQMRGFCARMPGSAALSGVGGDAPDAPDAYALGFADGVDLSRKEFAAERYALLALVASAEALRPEPSEELAAMIATTVERLVSELVNMAPIDGAWLSDRIDRAIACLTEADAARTLWLHPDDLVLIEDHDLPVQPMADATLERGSLRIDCSVGWVEDGRSLHLEALRASLGVGTSV